MIADQSAFHAGTLKWFSLQKGYGFIVPDEASRDVFVYLDRFEQSEIFPKRNKRLKFKFENRAKGMFATEIAEIPDAKTVH